MGIFNFVLIAVIQSGRDNTGPIMPVVFIFKGS